MKRNLEGPEVDLTGASHHQQWGQANPCPKCGQPGFLDHIDIIDHVQDEHCPDCGHTWTQTEAETSQA